MAVLAVAFVAVHRRIRLLSTVSLFILFFLTAGFTFTLVKNWEALQTTRNTAATESLYYDQFYRLSDQLNVIHIVPDQAQGAMAHDILSKGYEHYSKVFDGFTLFTQAEGQYKSTYPTVLLYMAAESPEPEFDLVLNQPYTREYIAKTLNERSIVTLLSQNEFNTFGFQFHSWYFCEGKYTACTGSYEEVFSGLPIMTSFKRLTSTVKAAMDLALFQSTPISVRKQVYDEGRWFFRKLHSEFPTHSGILDTFTQKMQVGDYPYSYNYFHHAGAHVPLLFDKDCTFTGPRELTFGNQQEQLSCTLQQLENLIRGLKRIGIYDQTMIVIHGDHGTFWLPPSYPRKSGKIITEDLMALASTLVLIKPPGARGALAFSELPVTTGDIPITIAQALGLKNNYPGVNMFQNQPVETRERYFYTFESTSMVDKWQVLPNLTRYRIRGDLFDELDWVLPDTRNVRTNPSRLNMGDADFLHYARGFSWLEYHDVPKRWVYGTRAQVFLSAPTDGPVALVFDCWVPAYIGNQWIEISVGGSIVAKLDENDLKKSRHRVVLPEKVTDTKVLEIDFTMGKTFSTEEDSRQLSVLFSYIGLESSD